MRDTPPELEQRFRKLLLERSGQERLKMGCSMHATTQALVKASLLQRHPRVHAAKLKRLLFLRFYGTDFEPEVRQRIASALAKRGRSGRREQKLPISGAVREKPERYRRKQESKAKRSRRLSD